MHEELIGQEASLSLPCSVSPTPLLLGFIEELMEVDGSEPSDPEGLEKELQGAVDALCVAAGTDPECTLVASLEIRSDSVEVRLTFEGGSAGSAPVEQVVTAHAA